MLLCLLYSHKGKLLSFSGAIYVQTNNLPLIINNIIFTTKESFSGFNELRDLNLSHLQIITINVSN